MNRNPTASELLGAVATWLRDADGGGRFDRLVAASAVDLGIRELALRAAADAAAVNAISALLGTIFAGRDSAEEALCNAIRQGALPPDDPALIDVLRRIALDTLAIDQPSYPNALEESFDA